MVCGSSLRHSKAEDLLVCIANGQNRHMSRANQMGEHVHTSVLQYRVRAADAVVRMNDLLGQLIYLQSDHI